MRSERLKTGWNQVSQNNISQNKISQNAAFPEISGSFLIDGVRINISAGEGVFPEGTSFKAEKATVVEEKQASYLVESGRGEDKNVAVSYTYDIKAMDKEGNEIQPADAGKVKVSFTLEEVADTNLETEIYHINKRRIKFPKVKSQMWICQ